MNDIQKVDSGVREVYPVIEIAPVDRQYIVFFNGDMNEQKEFEEMLRSYARHGKVLKYTVHAFVRGFEQQQSQVTGISEVDLERMKRRER